VTAARQIEIETDVRDLVPGVSGNTRAPRLSRRFGPQSIEGYHHSQIGNKIKARRQAVTDFDRDYTRWAGVEQAA